MFDKCLARTLTAAIVGSLLCLVAPSHAIAAGPAHAFDFNGDGHDELAVGVPGESVRTQNFAGAVNVFSGTATGPAAGGSQLWSQASAGIAGSAEFGDRFGAVVASGDFDGDGYADLAVGSPGEDVGRKTEAGSVSVLYGSSSGLAADLDQQWSQDSEGVPGSSEPIDRFGSSLAAGDLDGNGFSDLAIGVPSDATRGAASTGVVDVLYGSESGLRSKGARSWTQSSRGTKGSSEFDDQFGASLAAADVDGDGRADLAVGVPGENAGAGAVQLLRGSKKGLTASGDQLWSQDSPGVSGVARSSDLFGASVYSKGHRAGRGECSRPGLCQHCVRGRLGAVRTDADDLRQPRVPATALWRRPGEPQHKVP